MDMKMACEGLKMLRLGIFFFFLHKKIFRIYELDYILYRMSILWPLGTVLSYDAVLDLLYLVMTAVSCMWAWAVFPFPLFHVVTTSVSVAVFSISFPSFLSFVSCGYNISFIIFLVSDIIPSLVLACPFH